MSEPTNVVAFSYDGDDRLGALYNELRDTVESRCRNNGLTYASVLGVLDKLHRDIMDEWIE